MSWNGWNYLEGEDKLNIYEFEELFLILIAAEVLMLLNKLLFALVDWFISKFPGEGVAVAVEAEDDEIYLRISYLFSENFRIACFLPIIY